MNVLCSHTSCSPPSIFHIFLLLLSLLFIILFARFRIKNDGTYPMMCNETKTQQQNISINVFWNVFLNSTNSSSRKSHICTMYDHCLKETISSSGHRCEEKIWWCGQCSRKISITMVEQRKMKRSVLSQSRLGRWGKWNAFAKMSKQISQPKKEQSQTNHFV